MRKILYVFVLGLLVAQICARPGDKKDDDKGKNGDKDKKDDAKTDVDKATKEAKEEAEKDTGKAKTLLKDHLNDVDNDEDVLPKNRKTTPDDEGKHKSKNNNKHHSIFDMPLDMAKGLVDKSVDFATSFMDGIF